MSPRLALVLLLAAAACAMAWLAVYQVDDAFIVYRYARNIAHGLGFVFNPGERVEGVTCFLWTLALVPFAAAGASLPKVTPVLTAVCGLGGMAVVARRHAEIEERARLSYRDLLPGLLLAASPAYVYWSVGALETVPFALLVALALRDHARETSAPGATGMRSAIWVGLAGLVRPETPVVMAALLADRLIAAAGGRAWRVGLRESARWSSIVLAMWIPFLTFRRLYFGEWLPNTYYAKTGAPFLARLGLGFRYAQSWAASLLPSFGATGVAVAWLGVFLVAGVLAMGLVRRRLRPEALVVIALVAAVLFEGGDWMVFHRLLVPALPPLVVLVGFALSRGALPGRRAAIALVVAAVLGSGAVVAAAERNGGRGLAVNAEGYRRAHREIARYLDGHARPGDSVALMDVGIIGWYAPELRLIDITGLTDRAVAHAPGGFLDKRYPVEDLLSREPRFAVLVPGFAADMRIQAHPEFRSRYHELFRVNHRANWIPPSDYYLYVFERNGP
jgi:arabinofuranosyltransferase